MRLCLKSGVSPLVMGLDNTPGVSCPHQWQDRTIFPMGAEAPHPGQSHNAIDLTRIRNIVMINICKHMKGG